MEKLNTAAKKWSENDAVTRFEQSKGMSGYGLNESDFQPQMRGTERWLDDLVAVWTDAYVAA